MSAGVVGVGPAGAYAVFNANAIQGKHVWKGNLSLPATAMWTAIDGNSLPDISVNALVVDPLNSQHISIGTDRGVCDRSRRGSSGGSGGVACRSRLSGLIVFPFFFVGGGFFSFTAGHREHECQREHH